MSQTLSSILTTLKSFATDHYVISDFYSHYYPSSEHDNNYPKMVVEYQNAELKRGSRTITFSISFLDLMNKAKTNDNEISSDMLILCDDFFRKFYESNTNEADFHIEENIKIKKILQSNKDNAIGWTFDINIETKRSLKEKDVPLA